jgi:hypothetical protein
MGKLVIEVEPEASLTVNGVQVTTAQKRFESPMSGGLYTVVADREGYRSVSTSLNIVPGETSTKKLRLQETRHGAWLALAVPMTMIAVATGAGAIITFYAADGKPKGSSDYEDNKTANQVLQYISYPAIGLAALGYILYIATNRDRISDGPPIHMSAAPLKGGGLVGLDFRFGGP